MENTNPSAASRNIQRTLTAATRKAKAKLGTAWDTMPCLRDGAVAVEILAAMAAKDTDSATVMTAVRLITVASEFTAQTVGTY